ncbi:Crp/Fnr family transcriptional regulator [Niallia sp. NCCP-28]|uniref:Crp/Fnr family transcriptional regulator n=1 Tax=Niallia sp. NCCP-28 TaxID=2934712 RepID=UPI00208A11BA|nr:Crp/Fnr family transcriptional regulator [Niallia sp. NCCP-28]GKU83563.1 Crp/Fnr family transcriptional regulator [Niallia sp. NCCP-28]
MAEKLHLCSHHSCVSLVPIFNHLEEKHRKEITDTVQSVSYTKGDIIYQAGDHSDSLYIVSSGKIRIYRLSESGKEQLIRILYPGDFTGELALFNETTQEAYAEAMADTHICMMKRSDLQSLIIKYPAISFPLLAEFASRLEKSEKQAASFATEKVEKRIALYLTECIDDSEPTKEFMLPMSKKDLASYLGTTPETISRKLTELEQQGYIEQKSAKRIKVLDIKGLLLV